MKTGRETGTVIRQERIADGIWRMELACGAAANARPGQFVSLYCADGAHLLPRPISLCRIHPDRLVLVYRVAGAGTEMFSRLSAGDELDLMGPLGNGFPVREGRALLIGGGIGLPPLAALAHELPGPVTVAAGYRDGHLFLTDEFPETARLLIATEDGSAGTCGNVMDAIRANGAEADVIYACGPKPMLRAVQQYARETGTPAWLSLEEHMACGVGACLGCVCETAGIDEHSRVRNARICKDGPVFAAEEVVL